MIKVSAPGKIHLLGEWSVVWGKPAILAAINLRVMVTVIPAYAGIQLTDSAKWIPAFAGMTEKLQKVIESIVKRHLKIKTIPPYQLSISSQIPIGSGLGSSAAVSATYIAALLSFLKVKWDLDLINRLTFEAEKTFHGNPSGGDNTTVIYGGLISYIKGKSIQPLSFSVPPKLAKNFVIINTGTPKETTKEMIVMAQALFDKKPKLKDSFLNAQEKLVRELLPALKDSNEKELTRIIREGEKNLEAIGVVSSYVESIIRKIEKAGGAAKICGAGGRTGPTGVLLCYHPKSSVIQDIAKSQHLDYFRTPLGVAGLRKEN